MCPTTRHLCTCAPYAWCVGAILSSTAAKINKANKEGNTPLIGACWQGNTKAVEALLAAAPNLEAAGPASYCPPRHATHFEPLLLDLIDIL